MSRQTIIRPWSSPLIQTQKNPASQRGFFVSFLRTQRVPNNSFHQLHMVASLLSIIANQED